MHVVSGFLQSIKTFPSVDCVRAGPGKLVASFIIPDLNFLCGSSDFDALLPSVMSANIDVLSLSVVSSYSQLAVAENSGEVVSLTSICSVVFLVLDLVPRLKYFACLTKPVSDLTHFMRLLSFDI